MFYQDSLTLFLAGLLLCLLCGDASVRTGVVHFLKKRPALEGDGYGREMALGLILALCALMVRQTDLAVLILAIVMVVLGGKTGNIFPPFWGIPAFVLYGIYPSILSTILLLPVLFWPGKKCETMHSQRCIGTVLAVGFAAHTSPFQSGIWMVGTGSMMVALTLWGYLRTRTALSSTVLTIRPFLLLGVMHAAQLEGLSASAQAAASALLLDLALYVVYVLKPSWRLITLALPPLPGFVVMWLGMHAALGLTTGGAGWTMSGIVITVALVLLSVCDVVRSLPELRPVKITFPFVITAALLPVGVTLLGGNVVSDVGGSAFDHSLRSMMWFSQGGDGAVVAFPALWGVLIVFWLIVVRPWSLVVPSMLPHTRFFIAHGQQKYFALLSGHTPYFPWKWRQYMAILRRYGRDVHKRVFSVRLPLSEISLSVWLILLGSALAILGLAS